jgi:hypothetical protein
MAKTLLAVAAAIVGIIAAGCGESSQPHLARADVAPLIALADQIAREPACAQRRDLAALQTQATALINHHAVPARLQEAFFSGVNDLAGRSPACAPPPTPAPPEKGRGHGKGHDKHDHGDKG